MSSAWAAAAGEANAWAFWRHVAVRCGGRILDDDGPGVLLTGPTPSVRVGRVDPSVSGAELVDRARAVESDAAPLTVVTRADRDQDLDAWLLASGAVVESEYPIMVFDGVPPEADSSCVAVEIRAVAEDRQVEEYRAVTVDAWARHGVPASSWQAVITPSVLLDGPVAPVVAYLEGEAVSVALTLVGDGVAGVYWVATRAGFGRRGFGELVTWAVIRDGFERGARLATLFATEDGEPLYRRMGFETVSRFSFWRVAA